MQLWPDQMPWKNTASSFRPYMTEYLVEGSRCAIVICPGGAYYMRSSVNEGAAVAAWLNATGISAFVLEYRIAPNRAPTMCADVQRAIRLAKTVAKKHGISYVGVLGFSAGGHLAGIASVHYSYPFYGCRDAIDLESPKPDFTVLCYPVTDMHEFRHDGTRTCLIGEDASEAQKDFYSLYKQVTAETPSAFIWHTAQDDSVPAQNAMLYAQALLENKVPYELHVFPFGPHGLGLAKDYPHAHGWTEDLLKWLKAMGFH